MKKIAIFILGLMLAFGGSSFAQCNEELVNFCALDVGGATYLKDFKIKLKKGRKGQPAPVARFTVVLNKDTHYRFSVCDAKEYEGEAILQLYDNDKLLGSTYNIASGKTYKSFDFICNKSSVYHLFFSYKGGLEGCSVGILSFVKEE